uniref:Uncharacterized protein n=1 Tax=Myoviridae sp. ctwwN25 TaxID=2825209 RepID=A0A8S5PNI3_9CAUD|nr:MAG TPA: hypothetical protein [Myoviridae sp. ctwwN25]
MSINNRMISKPFGLLIIFCRNSLIIELFKRS